MDETREKEPWEICEERMHRTERVGACPVLRVEVSYPCLAGDAEEEGFRRFNDTYRRAAEAFVTWAVETLTPSACADFEAMGAGAAYRFARREAYCFITAHRMGDHKVAVDTRIRQGRRGDEKCQKIFVREDVWQLPQGWVCFPKKRRFRQIAKIKKNARNLLKKCR